MTWAIVILLGLIFLSLQFDIKGLLKDIRSQACFFSDTSSLVSAAKEYFERENRKERYTIPTEAEMKEEKEREENLRAETKWRIESEWGGWRKATLICRRQRRTQGGLYDLTYEYVCRTTDRLYTALGRLPLNSEGQPYKIGDEVEYFAGREFIVPDSKRGIANLILLEEMSCE